MLNGGYSFLQLPVNNNSVGYNNDVIVDDVIIAVNDKAVYSIGYLRYYLYQYSAGDKVTLTIQRGSEKKTVTVTLGSES